jgi:hypothetical protein
MKPVCPDVGFGPKTTMTELLNAQRREEGWGRMERLVCLREGEVLGSAKGERVDK